MEDETETTATEDLDQSDETAEDTQPLELPDDPEQLKEFAKSAASAKLQLQREREQLLSEKERLEENLEEQRTKSTYWATDAERLRAEIARLQGNGRTEQAKPETDSGITDDSELMDAVTAGMKVGDLKRMMTEIASRAADQKAAQVTQQGAHARQILAEYPDLTNDKSPLTKATITEMEMVDRENPQMSDQAKFELATRRSASRLGILPKTQADSNANRDEAERARRRAAQGGPTGKPSSSKGAVVITDADRAMARKMNGGQDVPDKLLIEAKKRLVNQQTTARV